MSLCLEAFPACDIVTFSALKTPSHIQRSDCSCLNTKTELSQENISVWHVKVVSSVSVMALLTAKNTRLPHSDCACPFQTHSVLYAPSYMTNFVIFSTYQVSSSILAILSAFMVIMVMWKLGTHSWCFSNMPQSFLYRNVLNYGCKKQGWSNVSYWINFIVTLLDCNLPFWKGIQSTNSNVI